MTTLDDGQNWEELNSGLDSTNVTSVYDLNGELYTLADTGVYKFDGKAWQNLNLPQVTNPNLEAYLDYSSKTFPIEKQLAGEMLEAHQEKRPSLQKSGVLPGNTPVTRLTTNNGQLFAGTAGDGLCVREGSLWKQAGFKGQSIADVTFSPDGSQGFLAACNSENLCSVYTNSDSGWIEITDGINNQLITDLLIAPDGESYAAGAGGIYRFEKTSGNWQTLLATDASLTTISSSEDGNWLAAIGEGNAWYSLNRGENWQIVESLDQSLTYTSALFTADGSLILGSNTGGAYKLELTKP